MTITPVTSVDPSVSTLAQDTPATQVAAAPSIEGTEESNTFSGSTVPLNLNASCADDGTMDSFWYNYEMDSVDAMMSEQKDSQNDANQTLKAVWETDENS